MKLFKCIIDDGKKVYKELVTAKNKKELTANNAEGKTFEKIEDVTNEYFTGESPDFLEETLQKSNCWGEGETKIIVALLKEHITKKKSTE